MPLLSAVFMGVITAVGGGMIRDVVAGQVPGIFGGGPLYAVPALISATCMVGFHQADMIELGMIVSPIPGIVLALVSYWRGWVWPVNSEWAPVNMTAAQARELARRAEAKGRRLGARAGQTVKQGGRRVARRVVPPPTRAAVVVNKLGKSVDEIAEDTKRFLLRLMGRR